MIRIDKAFVSRELAEAFVSKYLQDYHPFGYGTHLTIIEPDKQGAPYRVKGHRYASCD